MVINTFSNMGYTQMPMGTLCWISKLLVSNKHLGGEGGRGGVALGERISFFPTLLSFYFFDMHVFQLPYVFLFTSNFNTLISFTF